MGKALSRHKVGKPFRLDISDDGFKCERDTGRIASYAALDGIHVIRASVPDQGLEVRPIYDRLAMPDLAPFLKDREYACQELAVHPDPFG